MKNLLSAILVGMVIIFAASSAHDTPKLKKLSVKVFGNCGMCQNRIEGSLKKAEGITSATWDTDTKMLDVQYDAAKITVDEIKEKVTAVGYDFEDKKASDEAYNNLPHCCQYRENAE